MAFGPSCVVGSDTVTRPTPLDAGASQLEPSRLLPMYMSEPLIVSVMLRRTWSHQLVSSVLSRSALTPVYDAVGV